MKREHKRTGYVVLGALCMMMLAAACSKKDKPAPDEPIHIVPESTGVGTPLETGVTKLIGAAGGSFKSADQSLTITIPAGALAGNTTIGIQAITNTNLGGKGNAFRLTPHGQQFAKPVKIELNYSSFKDSLVFPMTAVFSYQGADGVWQIPSGSMVDTSAKTLTYETTHFSDWAMMERVSLKPMAAELAESEKLTIQALIFTDARGTCNCDDDLIAPLDQINYPYPIGKPALLPSKYIKGWKLIGPGSLNRTTGNSVEYKAPASIPGPATATVVAELNSWNKGKYFLLSTIKLSSESWIELSLSGAPAVKFPATPVTRMGDTYLLSNPEDEGGGYFLLMWTGEVGTHGFDLQNKNTWTYNAPSVSYASMYIPDPGSPLKASGGGTTITRLDGTWVEGTFDVQQAGYANYLRITKASGKFKAKLAK